MNEKCFKINRKFDSGTNVRCFLQYIGEALGKISRCQKVSRCSVIHVIIVITEITRVELIFYDNTNPSDLVKREYSCIRQLLAMVSFKLDFFKTFPILFCRGSEVIFQLLIIIWLGKFSIYKTFQDMILT